MMISSKTIAEHDGEDVTLELFASENSVNFSNTRGAIAHEAVLNKDMGVLY